MARQLTGGPLRLAYQSFGRVEGMEAYQRKLDELVQAAAPAHAAIDVLRLPDAIVAGKGFASGQALEVPALLRSLKRAVDAGYEAIAIGNGFDPGLWEARELFDVPVLGLFETVAQHALRAGWRYGVLCSGASGVTRIEELAARYGFGGRMVRPVAVGVSVPEVVTALAGEPAGARIAKSATACVAELASRGAEVVVVASGALDVFLAGHPIEDSPLPVLPSVTILLHELASAAALARSGVPYISRTGRFASPPEAVRAPLLED